MLEKLHLPSFRIIRASIVREDVRKQMPAAGNDAAGIGGWSTSLMALRSTSDRECRADGTRIARMRVRLDGNPQVLGQASDHVLVLAEATRQAEEMAYSLYIDITYIEVYQFA